MLAISATPIGSWIILRIVPGLDRRLLRRSAGKTSLSGLVAPTLLLVHVGRRTQQRHQTPLLYLDRGGCFMVIASGGGRHQTPNWYLNICAESVVEVLVSGERLTCVAQTLDDPERQGLWDQFVQFNPGFTTYQARIQRQIAIVKLTPTVRT